MVNIPAEYKEIINGLSELYIGNTVKVTIPEGTKSGWLEAMNVEPRITPPSISGMTCVGFVLSTTSTYRIQAPFVKRSSSGEWIASCYLTSDLPAGSSAFIFFRPLYVKS